MNKKYHLGIIGSSIFYQTFHHLLLEKENAITIHHATIEDALDDNDKYLECLKSSNYLFFEKANTTYFFLIENALKLSKHLFINQSSLSKNQMLECHHIVTEANLKCILLQPDNFYLHLKNINHQQTEHLTFEFKYPQSATQNLIDFFSKDIHFATKYLSYFFKEEAVQIIVNKYPIYATSYDFLLIFIECLNGKSILMKFSQIDEEARARMYICQQNRHFQLNLATNQLLLNEEKNTQNNIQIETEKANEIIDVVCKNKIIPHTLMNDIFAEELANKILKKLN